MLADRYLLSAKVRVPELRDSADLAGEQTVAKVLVKSLAARLRGPRARELDQALGNRGLSLVRTDCGDGRLSPNQGHRSSGIATGYAVGGHLC